MLVEFYKVTIFSPLVLFGHYGFVETTEIVEVIPSRVKVYLVNESLIEQNVNPHFPTNILTDMNILYK